MQLWRQPHSKLCDHGRAAGLLWVLMALGSEGAGLGEGQTHFAPHVTESLRHYVPAWYLAEARAPGVLFASERRKVGMYFPSKCLPFLMLNYPQTENLNCPQTENLPLVCSDTGWVFIWVLSWVVVHKCTLTRNPVCAFLFSPTGKLLFERLLGELLSHNQSTRAFMLVDRWKIGSLVI